MNTLLAKNLLFGLDKFDDRKIQMKAHMSALHDKMWDVITGGPIQIMKFNIAYLLYPNDEQYIPKPKMEWTFEDRTRNNLNNIAMDILY